MPYNQTKRDFVRSECHLIKILDATEMIKKCKLEPFTLF